MRTELRELQNLFETSQKERAELELELLHCREELEKLTEDRQVGLSLPKPRRLGFSKNLIMKQQNDCFLYFSIIQRINSAHLKKKKTTTRASGAVW